MRLRVAERARRDADRLLRWWEENRPAVPMLFNEELDRTLELIAEMPAVGVSWATERRPGLRRILMQRNAYHLYFEVDEPNRIVDVLAIWSAVRARGPRL